jgi:hypothetical protein
MLIHRVIREKKQRLEVIRAVHGIDQCVLHTPVLHTIPGDHVFEQRRPFVWRSRLLVLVMNSRLVHPNSSCDL